ncbi:UNKNOWN [Stylonychia lemnae]|uniref:Uncharacterized protein n=1 Tax=Stylonychia lemnae TaxID=5949 RepID=A0A078AF35_STYLE|nr:UNKNOWN [Stylonychia lemnae]|eukprot:CDW80421.1 UNKNOWN [Stylonychia lemnae]
MVSVRNKEDSFSIQPTQRQTPKAKKRLMKTNKFYLDYKDLKNNGLIEDTTLPSMVLERKDSPRLKKHQTMSMKNSKPRAKDVLPEIKLGIQKNQDIEYLQVSPVRIQEKMEYYSQLMNKTLLQVDFKKLENSTSTNPFENKKKSIAIEDQNNSGLDYQIQNNSILQSYDIRRYDHTTLKSPEQEPAQKVISQQSQFVQARDQSLESFRSINSKNNDNDRTQDQTLNTSEENESKIKIRYKTKSYAGTRRTMPKLSKKDEEERKRIQSLLRNNYYGNNFAVLQGGQVQKHNLKTRFPLHDMVIDDEDFIARMVMRKEDIRGLQTQLKQSMYQDKAKPFFSPNPMQTNRKFNYKQNELMQANY